MILRQKMNRTKVKVIIGGSAILAIFCFATLLFYYAYLTGRFSSSASSVNSDLYGTPMKHVPYDQIYNNKGDMFNYYEENFEYILKTKGCKIPMIGMLDFSNTTLSKSSCGKRAVFLNKIGDDTIKITIKETSLKKYLKGSTFSHCCLSFVQTARQVGSKNKKLSYTQCKLINDNDEILLESDFIKIQCNGYIRSNESIVVYEDVYGFTKKITTNAEDKNEKYNVLLLGVDSMSFFRVISTMPRVTKFMKEHYWLAYKGYHKVGDNTFPNLMAALTGKDISSVYESCSKGMDYCNDIMIWSEFKKAGYVTAYGEDYLRLPDTFSGHNAFHKQPTDHYIKPLFQTGERECGNGSTVCNGKVTSAQQLLDYAFDFALTYRHEAFFGAFWINSHSHNTKGSPRDLDKPLEDFLFRLTYSHIQRNTFIVLLSDHGIRFGPQRMLMKSYYDERMPALFVWVPPLFRSHYPKHYRNIIMNQRKLVTPYNLHGMLSNIVHNDLNNNEIEERGTSISLFAELSENITCSEARIHRKWCSCHKMHEHDKMDVDGVKSVIFVLNHIRNVADKVTTKSCWGCSRFSLKEIIRTHYYYDEQKRNLYHVVAFTLNPGNISYEATVLQRENSTLVGPISVISAYRGLGVCAVHHKDRLYCVCQKVENCQQ